MNLYTLSVPVIRRYLNQLILILDKVQQAVDSGEFDEQSLLTRQLRPDMFPLVQQINIASGFALRACYPLVKKQVPEILQPTDSLQQVKVNVQRSLELVTKLTEQDFVGAEGILLKTGAGKATLNIDSGTYLTQYALPNFFFHISMGYAILRQAGIKIGKADFDGFHQYAADFSFIE